MNRSILLAADHYPFEFPEPAGVLVLTGGSLGGPSGLSSGFLFFSETALGGGGSGTSAIGFFVVSTGLDGGVARGVFVSAAAGFAVDFVAVVSPPQPNSNAAAPGSIHFNRIVRSSP